MYESYINKIEDIGKLRNLKPGTIRTYQNNVRDFLKFINKHPDELTCEDARDFLASAIAHSEHSKEFYSEAIVKEGILYYDGGYLDATNFRVEWDGDNCETILVMK